ncbi:MAG: serine/threonine protein kinase [Labilithrix sp.]|nr:serine/threonine protein kinase [Labilithrix sp.]MCW5817077.1 serine/threonine protein kinase [Labilithrix sp.]
MSANRRFGPFILDARIAVGGTAEVYLAHPATEASDLPQKLVVKRLLPHFAGDPEGRTMFHREARLHAAVTHENVVTVYHAGTDERGEPYLAMEYIEGVDGYRLLRKLRQEGEFLPIGVAIYIAREILRALESVHAALDPESGGALGIIHRDVSPSNIYLSKDGTVKLGDFGIARSTTRATLRSEAGHVLKGKFAYLSPEQVAGETSDQRADLFSLATVLAEMLLNRPLFPGGGQLAILLAIRDCKIDALEEIKPRLPPGLFEVMERGLARAPSQRFPDAAAFAAALAPFEADKRLAAREIAARVRWVKAHGSSDTKLVAQRDSAAMRAVAVESPRVPSVKIQATRQSGGVPRAVVTREEAEASDPGRPSEQKTMEYQFLPSRVLKKDGTELGPWTFAKLMEGLATGQVERGDRVDFIGRGFRLVEDMEEFARFFPAPPSASSTAQIQGPGAPDLKDQIGPDTILKMLMLVLAQSETGVLFAERAKLDPSSMQEPPESRGGRKELYFVSGKLHHVATSNSHELLGEYLVRKGKLGREELDLALAVLPRYSGRMGDTLISMGLVGPVDIFRAIRDQGRDRVADLFLWRGGQLSFYRGHTAPHVEFPLDLELPALMLAGLETAKPGDAIINEHRDDLDRNLGPAPPRDDLMAFESVIWPPAVTNVRELVRRPTKLRDLMQYAAKHRSFPPGDILRAIEILLAAGLLEWE